MGLKKKTINLVKKVLNNENKRKMYSPEELAYMETQLELLIAERERRIQERKLKGFGKDVDKPKT
jgi:hypothetical protein